MQLLQLAGHHGAITSVAWSRDGTRLATCSESQRQGEGGELFVWEVHSGERVHAFEAHPGVVSALSWVPSGELLISGGGDGTLRWWDLQSRECVRVQEAHQGTVHSLKMSPDGSRLASCGDDGAIRLWTSTVASSCKHCGGIGSTSASLSRASEVSPRHNRRRCARWGRSRKHALASKAHD
jgi:WD40 repeat protein